MSKDSTENFNKIQLSTCMWRPLKYICYSVSDSMKFQLVMYLIFFTPDGCTTFIIEMCHNMSKYNIFRILVSESPWGPTQCQKSPFSTLNSFLKILLLYIPGGPGWPPTSYVEPFEGLHGPTQSQRTLIFNTLKVF